MRGAQARMSRPHKPCARHDAYNLIYLKSDPRRQKSEMSDRERASARCCLQSFTAFEHHGVEIRQHAHTACSLLKASCLSTAQRSVAVKALLLRAPPRAYGGYSRTLCCACLVLTASPVLRPCPLVVWQDGLPFRCGERPCDGDGGPSGPRCRPERQNRGTRTTRELYD